MFFSSNEKSAWCGALISVHDDKILPVDFFQHPSPHLLDGIVVLALLAFDEAGDAGLKWHAIAAAEPDADGKAKGVNLSFPVIAKPGQRDLFGQLDGLAKREIVLSYIHNNQPRSYGVMIFKM
jgi:hypothetical protein